MLYSNFHNKEVYAVKKAEYMGRVQGIYIDSNTKKPFALMLKNNEKIFFLPFRRITGNTDKITVYSSKSLFEYNEQELKDKFLLQNSVKAITEDGTDLGCFQDITLKGDKLIWFDKPYPTKYVAGAKDNIITINFSLKSDRKPKPEPKQKPAIQQKQASPYVPKEKIINDYSFLLGRIVIRDIIDKNTGVHIKKGTVINETTINMAKKCGKLVHLALSSLLD
ncbi:MAG: PRC-barrel domain-containing protein [Bacillota bacterium]